MKATVERFIKAMKLCAEAHNVEFKDWSDENQVALQSECVPVVSDVKMIAEAFFGERADVEVDYGYSNVYVFEEYLLDEVDEVKLSLALPYGWIDKVK